MRRTKKPGRPGARSRRVGRPPSTSGDGLTRRQRQIAIQVSKGLTNPEIARNLGISQFTVATHLQRIFTKLKIHSRVKLARQIDKLV